MNKKSEFYTKHVKQLEKINKKIKDELIDEVIPFWENRIVEPGYPGYLNGFDRKGVLTDTYKAGWFIGRNMYMFATLYNHLEKRESWKEIASIGRKCFDDDFYLGEGRFAKMLDRSGKVKEGATSIFTDHFAVKALYEYILMQDKGREEQDVALAERLSEYLFENVKNPEILSREGVGIGFQKHAINFMTLLVALESKAVFGDKYKDLVIECTQKTLYEYANDEHEVLFENIGLDGKPKLEGEGRVVDPGHAMEALWFAMKAGKIYGKPEYIERAGQVLDWVIARCYDEEYGGFYQNTDFDKHIPEETFKVNNYAGTLVGWDDKIWWVQAEGLNALCMGALYNENEKQFEYFLKLYEYIQQYFRDHIYGEWYSFRKRDGKMLSDVKGFELKGAYHVPRCLLQVSNVIEGYLNQFNN